MTKALLVAITGAGGHVGGHLWRHCTRSSSMKVRAHLRAPCPLPPWAHNLSPVIGDLDKPDVRHQFLRGADVVVHSATRGYSTTHPPSADDLTREIEVAGRLATEAFEAGVQRLIFVSSVHVYGAALAGKVDESTAPLPTTEYGKSRLEIEQLLLDLAGRYHATTVNIRMSNTFGFPALPNPRTWDLLVHDLCRQAVEVGSLTLHTNGRGFRDLLAIRDATTVIEQLMHSQRAVSGTYLLSSGNTRSIREIAEWVAHRAAAVLGFTPDITINDSDSAAHHGFILMGSHLGELGVTVSSRHDEELDELLVLAGQTFASAGESK